MIKSYINRKLDEGEQMVEVQYYKLTSYGAKNFVVGVFLGLVVGYLIGGI